MAINITTEPYKVHPINSDNKYQFLDDAATGDLSMYYKVKVNDGTTTYTYKIFPNKQGIGEFNPRYLLDTLVDKSLVYNESTYSTNTDAIVTYTVTVESYFNDVLSLSTVSDIKYAYNGLKHVNDGFDITEYLLENGPGTKFLNGYNNIDILNTDTITLQLFTGDFNGSGTFTGIRFEVHKVNGTTENVDVPMTIGGIGGITSINVSPSVIVDNSLITLDEISYYKVSELTGITEEKRINIVSEDTRYDRQYRFAYLSRNGETNYVNFNKADREKLSIDIDTFSNGLDTAINNITAEQTLTVISDYMGEDKSFELKYFWTSPEIYHLTDNGNHKVILDVKSISVIRKKENNLISYSMSFKYSEQYNTIN